MTKYPQFRVSQWLDNSDEAMAREQATIIYGVQTKREKGGKWQHVCNGSGPLFCGSREDAHAVCKILRDRDART
jgi:hypothetical protein